MDRIRIFAWPKEKKYDLSGSKNEKLQLSL